MKRSTQASLCATVAISAALAFGSTQAFAQDAVPAIELPAPAAPAPAAPAPTIVLPPAAIEAPSAEPAPSRVERAARPARTAARQTAAAPAPAPQAPAAEVAPTATGPSAPVAVVPPAPAPAAAIAEAENAEPQRDSVQSTVDFPDELIAAIAAGVIGLGIVGLVGMRRRRRQQAEAYDEVYEPAPRYVSEPQGADVSQTVIPEELAVQPPFAVNAAAGQHSATPAGLVPAGDARQDLIDRMVAAAPDSANPFTTAKARRRRARLILQASEHRQREQAAAPFDWRTYRSPDAPATPTAPLVDA